MAEARPGARAPAEEDVVKSLWVQTAIGTVALMVLGAAFVFLLPKGVAGGPVNLPLLVASNALVAATLSAIAQRLGASRVRRVVVLWLIWGGIQATNLVEAILFDIGLPPTDVARIVLHALAVAAGFSALVGLAFLVSLVTLPRYFATRLT